MSSDSPAPAPDPPSLPAPLDRVETAWARWLAVLDQVPDSRTDEPVVGIWSVKDLIGHVALWDEQALDDVRRGLSGEPEPAVDWEALNLADAAANAGRTLAQQRERMRTAHAALVASLARLPPGAPAPAAVRDWIRVDTDEHYDIHAAEVAAWLAGG